MSPAKINLLVVDDEPQIRKFLKIALESHGFNVIEAMTGQEGLVFAAEYCPQAIILDLGLPDMDGQQVLQSLREWYKKTIIILSVRNDEENIVMALNNGANDYLRKPFSLGELLARLRVCMRLTIENATDPVLRFKDLQIDIPAHKVLLRDAEIKFTVTEFALLKLLALNAGKVLTHKYILTAIWGAKAEHNLQYLRVYIGHLRQKIETDCNRPEWIMTEPGVGYRFNS